MVTFATAAAVGVVASLVTPYICAKQKEEDANEDVKDYYDEDVDDYQTPVASRRNSTLKINAALVVGDTAGQTDASQIAREIVGDLVTKALFISQQKTKGSYNDDASTAEKQTTNNGGVTVTTAQKGK